MGFRNKVNSQAFVQDSIQPGLICYKQRNTFGAIILRISPFPYEKVYSVRHLKRCTDTVKKNADTVKRCAAAGRRITTQGSS
jgi:hypothetical protein